MELSALTRGLRVQAVRLCAAVGMTAVLALGGCLVATAEAQDQGARGQATAPTQTTLREVAEGDVSPLGRERSSREVISAALQVPEIRRLRRDNPGSYVRAYLLESPSDPELAKGWQVSVFAPPAGASRDKEIGQVIVDDRTGDTVEAWTGFQVEWTMARGYPGAFGRKANAPYVWIALLILFLLPFLRPPWRLLHLDLTILCAFSISYAFFGAGEIGWSVPLAYPCLVYLLVRMLTLAWARAQRLENRAFHVKRSDLPAGKGPLRLVTAPSFLTMGVIFLVGFRLGLNYSASNVIDVGYSGVIGADLLAHGETLYGGFPSDSPRGDTYGPVNYLAYVPFEWAAPWKGVWDDLPAAHLAAAAFDLGSAALLWLVGARWRDRQFGLLLAYLWLAFPFTLLVANSGANDSLVALLVLTCLSVAGRPVARGIAVAAAGLTKFAPFLLGPLLATFRPEDAELASKTSAAGDDSNAPARGEGGRAGLALPPLVAAARTAAAAAGAAGLFLLPAILGTGGISAFWERTVAFQADRDSPFSVWGFVEGDLDLLQRLIEFGTLVLAVAVAFVPRSRDLVSLAALAAAILIAAQIAVTHWFYLYIVWFLPLVLIAVLADVDHHHFDDSGDVDFDSGGAGRSGT